MKVAQFLKSSLQSFIRKSEASEKKLKVKQRLRSRCFVYFEFPYCGGEYLSVVDIVLAQCTF